MNIDLYRSLFVHRSDVYARQFEDGHYEPVKEPLTDDDLAEHLAGFSSYGVYVIDPAERTMAYLANTVSYVVFDLDTYSPDAYTHLIDCVQQLIESTAWGQETPDLTAYQCLLLENSGGKGWHVWLFLSEPLPAAQVRAWVQSDFMPRWGHDWPIEVFPKQDTVEGGYGNLVKLPLGVHAKSGKRSEIALAPGWADSLNKVVRLPASLVPDQPLARKDGTSDTGSTGPRSGGSRSATPFPCVSKIIEEGIASGNRDNAMFYLARFYRGHGVFDPKVALQLCLAVNASFAPPLKDWEVKQKVTSAYRGETTTPRCTDDWLQGFCPGGPRCFAPWNTERQSNNKPPPVEVDWRAARDRLRKARDG